MRAIITAPGEVDRDAAIEAARAVPAWADQDFVGQVSVRAPYEVGDRGPLIAVVDLGLKTNIVRALRRRGARVRVLPHTVTPSDVLAADVDGVVLSPGPGDPGILEGPVALAHAVVRDGRPLLGICLGHQIVARAAGAETRRLRFGHHGANHPVRDEGTGSVVITAQNHEVEVVGDSLPAVGGLLREPAQPQRRVGRGAAPSHAAHRDRPVPPRGIARPARRRRGLRPLPRPRPRQRRPWGELVTERPASVLIIGSGPVIIGQAAEFDYAGTQACRALREEGVRTILLNSNPATIMTDPDVADAVYLEPLTLTTLEGILDRERPEGVLAGLGGQTALNLAMDAGRAGLFERYGTRLLGTPLEAIEMAEDRERFRDLLDSIGQPYAPSAIVEGATPAERQAAAERALDEIGLPAVIRPAFTLGGTGGGIVDDRASYDERVRTGLRLSPIGQVMVERCLVGWQEIEYEVMRDAADTCIAVCSMENVDPLGCTPATRSSSLRSRRCPTPCTSASGARRSTSSGRSASRAAATSSSRCRPTPPTTPSSR